MQSLQSKLDKQVRQARPAASSHSRQRAAYVATRWHTLPYSPIAKPADLYPTLPTLVLLEPAQPSTPLSPLGPHGETSWSPVRRTLQHLPVLLTLWVWGGTFFRFQDLSVSSGVFGHLCSESSDPEAVLESHSFLRLRAGTPSRIRHARDYFYGPASPSRTRPMRLHPVCSSHGWPRAPFSVTANYAVATLVNYSPHTENLCYHQ
jgi:hypothetical protein